MRNVESSMDWMSFSNKMKQVAWQLSSSACPMVLGLPDGREIRFADIEVGMFNYKGKRGDTEYTSIGFKVNLLGAEVIDVQNDGSLANSPSGNGAKMREALEKIAHYDDSEYGMDDYGCADGHICADIARTALAEPARNCDVIAPQNLVDEFCKFMDFDIMDERNGFADGQYKFMQEHWFEFSKWITMPYAPKEGSKE